LAPVEPGTRIACLIGFKQEFPGLGINGPQRVQISGLQVVVPDSVFAEKLKVLSRIEVGLEFSEDKVLAQQVGLCVEDIETLVQFGSPPTLQ